MSDATTKKLTEEIARLESDLKTLEASCTTSEAAKKIAGYCQSTADPFLGENEGGFLDKEIDNEEPNTVLNGVVTFGKATYKLDFYTSVRTL
ncbi:hypothetical protein PITG_16898 [Plasmopara halstedii]|uniref:G protein gamma domain-containing protein n=1 Tax=Plasmopara halstedii TaxID=4781 RepID=A0A0P1B1X4_PLAHL|nr:hypothetical protein PITG_16898 [Plasmopara halstedii]CEG47836.1 hypothetical protein PITG_16898 [Plasmopara halstedii]|eukprot:XP_024584205.1 hypothetical protein PITG_16898 [Plasmopara halstedii]